MVHMYKTVKDCQSMRIASDIPHWGDDEVMFTGLTEADEVTHLGGQSVCLRHHDRLRGLS
jgi:hypothetical protein